MEIVYAALLLHKLGKPVDEAGVKKIIEAAGGQADDAKVKSLLASLKDVDIDKELESAVVASAAPAAGGEASEGGKAAGGEAEAPKEEKNQHPKPEAAAEGLSALFG